MTEDLKEGCQRSGASKLAPKEDRKSPDPISEQYRAERGKDDDTEAFEEIQIPGIPGAYVRIERTVKDGVK